MNNLYSFIDKAVKKRVIHKNNAARKKSSINKLAKIIYVSNKKRFFFNN